MCRLAAWFGPPLPLDRLVFEGPRSLATQAWAPRELLSGSVNADGWGVAWWTGEAERPVRIARPEPIWYDPDLPTLLGSLASGSALAVLRNATPGLPVDRSGLLPLVRDRWSFALNGYLPAFRARHMRKLRELLPDALYARLEGVSDAETLFHLALARIASGASPRDALLSVCDSVADRLGTGETAPLTIVLSERVGLTVLHTTLNGAVNSLYIKRRRIALEGGADAEGVLVASERFDDDGWERVPEHSTLVVGADGVRIDRL
ncbi:MAG: hypothetical protein RQ745_02520 [Longimicrobiales bacterium]|nr:hypothetical protein [Longimicrobiales bacterium]